MMYPTNLLPIWLVASTLYGAGYAASNETTILVAVTTNNTTIFVPETVSVVPILGNAPTPTPTLISAPVTPTPTCDPSKLPEVFIIQPEGSGSFLVPTWNASVGGFELLAAGTAADATPFFFNATCDYYPGDDFCSLYQLSFNYTCPDDGIVTTYSAYVDESGGAPMTFYDAATADTLTIALRVIILSPEPSSCDLSLIVWGEHDLSNPFLQDGVLWLGADFNNAIDLAIYSPISA